MRRLLIWLLAGALAVAGVSFVAAPYVAFFAVRSAADAQDVQGLSQLIDFDQVRASLRAGQANQPAAAPSFWQDPVGAVKHAIAPVTQPPVDPYLTPRALSNLTRGEAQDSIRPQAPNARPPAPWPTVQYWGVNRCRLAVHADGHGDTVFTFERQGLFTWKLVQIGLPAK